jgi:hypothetical protein
MKEIETEPLATPTETPEAPQPTESAKPPIPDSPALPASTSTHTSALTSDARSLLAVARKSPGKVTLYAAAIFFGLLAIDFVAQIPRWMKESRVRRIQAAINSITPDATLARCGQPLEDVTNDLYPMISRRMTYNYTRVTQTGDGHGTITENGKVVLFFTRTSEEKSDWVFASMRDQSSATAYSTPEEQAAVLPCLASTK